MKKMQVTLYTTTTCPYCKMLKNYLSEKNVKFTEKLVDQDDTAREEMSDASGGFMGVPFTVVIRDDGSKETVVGFDKGKINDIFGIK